MWKTRVGHEKGARPQQKTVWGIDAKKSKTAISFGQLPCHQGYTVDCLQRRLCYCCVRRPFPPCSPKAILRLGTWLKLKWFVLGA